MRQVQNPTIAPVLIDLLRTLDLQLGFLRPYAFIGINGSESDQHQVRCSSDILFRNSNMYALRRRPSAASRQGHTTS